MAMGSRIWDKHIRAGLDVVLLAVEDELRASARDEVQLLVPELRALGVRLDHVDPRFLGGVGVRPEGLDAEREANRSPRKRAGPGHSLDLVEANDLRLTAQKTGVSVYVPKTRCSDSIISPSVQCTRAQSS